MTPILIRKYGNRKYYRTDESEYVTLKDIKKLILDGADVKVVDHKTKNDLTLDVLQAIAAKYVDIELALSLIRNWA